MENEIRGESLKLTVALNLIADGNKVLLLLTSGKGRSIEKESVMKAQMMVNAGVETSSVINEKIENLKAEIKKLTD